MNWKVKRKQRGSMLIDSLMGAFVLSLSAIAYFALVPTTHRLQQVAKEYTVANAMANRFIEQLQLLKPSDINAATLTSLDLIDAGQSAPPYNFSHIPLDEASGYSPSRMLKGGSATMNVTSMDAGSKKIDI